MKICLYTNTVFKLGGVARVVSILSSAWQNNDKVTIIATHPDYPIDYSIYQLDRRIKIIFKPSFFECDDSGTCLTTSSAERLSDYLKREAFDVIIAVEGLYALMLAPLLKQLPNHIAIAWMHNSYQAYFKTEDAYLWKKDDIFQQAIHAFDYCVLLTQQDKVEFDQAFNLHTVVIANPVTFNLDEIQINKVRKPQLLTVCRLDMRHKGLDLLLEALPSVFSEHPDWQWVLVGDGPDKETIMAMIEEKHLSSHVDFVGPSYDVPTYYQQASIFVLPSRWEGLPMVSLEAMAFGLPLAGFDIGALREVLGTTLADQWLVEPYDINKLSKGINTMIELYNFETTYPQLQQRIANFTMSAILSQWDILFRR